MPVELLREEKVDEIWKFHPPYKPPNNLMSSNEDEDEAEDEDEFFCSSSRERSDPIRRGLMIFSIVQHCGGFGLSWGKSKDSLLGT